MEEKRASLLGNGSGAHSAYLGPGGELVVEWYDFGPDAPYESSNMLVFDTEAQAALAASLKLTTAVDAGLLLQTLQERFRTYFEVREFSDTAKLRYDKRVDFNP